MQPVRTRTASNFNILNTAQPLHWIYSDDAISSAISSDPEKPEFLNPSRNNFYKLSTGSQSNYGDEMMVTIRSLAHSNGMIQIQAKYIKQCT